MPYYETDSDTEFQENPKRPSPNSSDDDDFWMNNKYARVIPRDVPPMGSIQHRGESFFASLPEIENEIELPLIPQKRKLNLPLKFSLLCCGLTLVVLVILQILYGLYIQDYKNSLDKDPFSFSNGGQWIACNAAADTANSLMHITTLIFALIVVLMLTIGTLIIFLILALRKHYWHKVVQALKVLDAPRPARKRIIDVPAKIQTRARTTGGIVSLIFIFIVLLYVPYQTLTGYILLNDIDTLTIQSDHDTIPPTRTDFVMAFTNYWNNSQITTPVCSCDMNSTSYCFRYLPNEVNVSTNVALWNTNKQCSIQSDGNTTTTKFSWTEYSNHLDYFNMKNISNLASDLTLQASQYFTVTIPGFQGNSAHLEWASNIYLLTNQSIIDEPSKYYSFEELEYSFKDLFKFSDPVLFFMFPDQNICNYVDFIELQTTSKYCSAFVDIMYLDSFAECSQSFWNLVATGNSWSQNKQTATVTDEFNSELTLMPSECDGGNIALALNRAQSQSTGRVMQCSRDNRSLIRLIGNFMSVFGSMFGLRMLVRPILVWMYDWFNRRFCQAGLALP